MQKNRYVSTVKSLNYPNQINRPLDVKQEAIRMTKEFENINEQETNIDEGKEANPTDESLNTDEQTKEGVGNQRIPYERFKAKVDEANALKEKLAEIEREQEEAKRKELEETEQYKELYEQAIKEKEQARQEASAIRKQALLSQAGYDDEQSKLLVKLVEGDDEESIAESIKQIQSTVPVKDNFGDPSAFNGAKAKPKTVDAEELGRSAVSRVLHKIKL